MEEYLRSLQQQLKGFPAKEQAALVEEIKSHIEGGEADPRMGGDAQRRRSKLMKELGSPEDMGRGFRQVYRSGRIMDYALILIPFLLYPYLNTFYNNIVMPRYAGGALLLDITIHLPLVLIGLWRKSAAVVLFWAGVLISQLFIVTGRLYSYYGWQTAFWAIILAALIVVVGRLVWGSRNDPLVIAFGLLIAGMAIAGGLLNIAAMMRPFALWIWRGGSGWAQYAANGMLDRSLLEGYIHVRDTAEFYSVLALGLFLLPSRREIRWLGLALAGLMMGLGHRFLLEEQNLMAPWIYMLWVIFPLAIAGLGWWTERNQRHKVQAML